MCRLTSHCAWMTWEQSVRLMNCPWMTHMLKAQFPWQCYGEVAEPWEVGPYRRSSGHQGHISGGIMGPWAFPFPLFGFLAMSWMYLLHHILCPYYVISPQVHRNEPINYTLESSKLWARIILFLKKISWLFHVLWYSGGKLINTTGDDVWFTVWPC